MFSGFANLWTIVAQARELRSDALFPLHIANERVVLFRGRDGEVAALIDRCPHRGVALSLGKLRNGEVECPFHGWRFDGAGRACHIPWNPDAKLGQLGATALPVREAGGLIWLYTGFAPADEPFVPEILTRSDVALCGQSAVWDAHWTRVMENMLDSPHLPFVHARTIGKFVAPYLGRRMDLSWTPMDYGARIENQVEGRDQKARLDYRYPNVMELFIDPPGRVLRMLAVCAPETDRTTRLTIYTLRSFMRARLFDPFFARANRRIALEDQKILESSDPFEVPPAGQERSVRTDAPTLAFRKIYFERIRDSSAESPGRETA